MLLALRHSVRAKPDCLSSVEEPWKLLPLLPTWDFLCLRSQRELSLKHRGTRTLADARGQCPWLMLAVGFTGCLGGTPRSFTGSFFLPQFPRGRLPSNPRLREVGVGMVEDQYVNV